VVPNLIVSNGNGNFLEVPELQAAGVNFIKPLTPQPDELIPLPDGSQMVELPRRVAIGYDADLKKYLQLREYNGGAVFPVAVSLPGGYLQMYRSAFSMVLDSPRLSPANYTMAGRKDNQYFTTAIPISRKLFSDYDILSLNNREKSLRETIDQAAFQLHRSPNGLLPVKIDEEKRIAEITEMIKSIRQETDRGLICVNSNLVNPEAVRDWCNAGADWIGLNFNSAQPKFFERFYKNRGYKLDSLLRCLHIINQYGAKIILNYGIFPGLTDHPHEIKALEKLVEQTNAAALHPYNLPVDPEWYMDKLLLMTISREQVSMRAWWEHIKGNYPDMEIGYLEDI
jgi:hypothetical protein